MYIVVDNVILPLIDLHSCLVLEQTQIQHNDLKIS